MPAIRCNLTLGKPLHLTTPQFPSVKLGAIYFAYNPELLRGFKELIWKHFGVHK